MRIQERLLAVDGVHELEGTEACALTHVEPASALDDQHWKDALVVRASSEGRAELACGSQRAHLSMVMLARLDLVLVDDRVTVGKRFHVRAVPRDREGRELEIGKWTQLVWKVDGAITEDNDPLPPSSVWRPGPSGSAASVHRQRRQEQSRRAWATLSGHCASRPRRNAVVAMQSASTPRCTGGKFSQHVMKHHCMQHAAPTR